MSENPSMATPDEVLRFWFDDLNEEDWWKKNPDLDREIDRRFAATHLSLAGGIADDWRQSADTILALIVVLDQFPRNIYRGTPLAFATDGLALREAKAAVDAGQDQLVDDRRRLFIYLPFEHSEVLADQERCVELVAGMSDENYLDYARRHHDVIVKFGRFPHRNSILGRESTAEELVYLAQPGSGF